MDSALTDLGLTHESAPPSGFDPRDVAPCWTGDEVQPTLSVALDVSGRCNLACRYCAEAASQPEREFMAAEVMEAAVRLLDLDTSPEVRPSIRIGSGEALLAQPLLRQLHALLADFSAEIDVFVTTNGTLIDDRVADWLASTGWRIKISMDGPPFIHDAWRCDRAGGPTHERAAQAVQRMVARCPERTSVAAVLCHGADPGEVFQAIAALGVGRIELVPVACRPGSREPDPCLTVDDVAAYVRFINEYAATVALNGAASQPTLVRFEDCVRNVMGYGNSVLPCGAGRSYVCVGPDGALYPCFRFAGLDAYRIGMVETGIDPGAAATFRAGAGRPSHRRSPCSNCWAAPLCGGPCFSVAEFFGDGNGEPNPLHCAYKLADARAACGLVNRMRERNTEGLLSFLPAVPEFP